MKSQEQLLILQDAADGALPIRIDSDKTVSRVSIAELISNGYLSAAGGSSSELAVFVNVSITDLGRARLRMLREEIPGATRQIFFRKARNFFKLLIYFVAAILVANFLFGLLTNLASSGR